MLKWCTFIFIYVTYSWKEFFWWSGWGMSPWGFWPQLSVNDMMITQVLDGRKSAYVTKTKWTPHTLPPAGTCLLLASAFFTFFLPSPLLALILTFLLLSFPSSTPMMKTHLTTTPYRAHGIWSWNNCWYTNTCLQPQYTTTPLATTLTLFGLKRALSIGISR